MTIQGRVSTPCIGMCSTTYGDSVCRGCKRFAHEIVDWNCYDEHQKAAVISRLTQIIDSIVTRYLVVTNPNRIEQVLQQLGLRYRSDQPPSCWAYDLFRHTKGRIASLQDVGLARGSQSSSLDYPAIWEAMSSEFLAISEGYYELYFRQPLSFD